MPAARDTRPVTPREARKTRRDGGPRRAGQNKLLPMAFPYCLTDG